MWTSLLIGIPITYIAYKLIYWRGFWPCFIWYIHLRPKNYVPGRLWGWYDLNNLSEFWYTQPISYEEYQLRIELSEWIASRSAIKEGYGEIQPVKPYLTNYQIGQAVFWYIWSLVTFTNDYKEL